MGDPPAPLALGVTASSTLAGAAWHRSFYQLPAAVAYCVGGIIFQLSTPP